MKMGEGGSIPLITQLNEKYQNADFIVTGILGPMSNAHSSNECLNLSYYKKIVKIFAEVLSKVQ